MKKSKTQQDRQMNLSLLIPAPLEARDQQKELTLALVELLINAAQEMHPAEPDGDKNESDEAHA